MTAAEALELVNAELARYGQPPRQLTDYQMHRAFASLQAYAFQSGRPLDVAIADVVRHQMQEQAQRQTDPAEFERQVQRMRWIMNERVETS